MEGLWNLGLEKPLIIEISLSCSVEAWEIRMLKAQQTQEVWLVMFETIKTLPGHLGEEYVLSCRLWLKNQL